MSFPGSIDSRVPVLNVAAWSGTGKTTLLEALLPRLRANGLRVAVIKHAHHDFDIDKPGKDSHRLRSAGAVPMVVASGRRYALMVETPECEQPDLAELVALVETQAPDLILVEGFKAWPIPRLELYRGIDDQPRLAGDDPWVEAIAWPRTSRLEGAEEIENIERELPARVERLDLDDIDAILQWVLAWRKRTIAMHPE